MKFPYDTGYFPPAPSIDIFFGPPEESLSVGPLSAFVDSGADATIVPIRHIRLLQTQADDRKYLRSQWGERRTVDIYFVDLGIGDVGIGNVRLPLVEIVADEKGDEVILGRNVLNQLRVLLDGPRGVVDVSA